MNISLHLNPTPYQLLLWYKLEAISEVLDLDKRFFIVANFTPVFKTLYALTTDKNECKLSWSKELIDANNKTYTSQYYKEFRYFYGLKQNSKEDSKINQEFLSKLSECELLSYLFDIKQSLLDAEKCKIEALKEVHDHNTKVLLNKCGWSVKRFEGRNNLTTLLGNLSLHFALPLMVPVTLFSDLPLNYIGRELDTQDKAKVQQTDLLIQETTMKLENNLKNNLPKDLFIHMLSGDDWRQKMKVQKHKKVLLAQVVAETRL